MINAADFIKWLEVFNVDYGPSAGTGTVSPGLINEIAYYAAAGDTVSGLTTANNGILSTDGSGVPAINNTVDLVGQLNVDNLRLDGNTVSTTNTNGNLVLAPNGIGNITSTRNIFLSSGVNSGVTTNVANTFAGTSSSAGYSFTTGSGVARLSSFSTAYTFELGLAGRVLLGSNASVTAGILLRPDAGGLTITTNGSVDDPNLFVDSSGNTSLSGSLSVTGTVTGTGTTLNAPSFNVPNGGKIKLASDNDNTYNAYNLVKKVASNSTTTFLQVTVPNQSCFFAIECFISNSRSITSGAATSQIQKKYFSIARAAGSDVVLDSQTGPDFASVTTTAGGVLSAVYGQTSITRNGAEGPTSTQVVNLNINPATSGLSFGSAIIYMTILAHADNSFGFAFT